MDFRLTFPIQPLGFTLSYRHKILLAGSCFAENMGDEMAHHRLDAVQNPHGILYNPVSLAQSLQRVLENTPYTENDLFFYNDVWNSWHHHSRFSHPDKEACLSHINTTVRAAHAYLTTGNLLVVTFGSAFAYRLKSNGQLVGNCHKYPNKEFDKQLLAAEDILSAWETALQAIQAANPGLHILFTVSPVRYVRDGVVENNLSKAILLQAVHSLCARFGNTHYFPAYELVMDDLRDYRFFEADLVHPNRQAIQYVWEHFTAALFDEETRVIYNEVKLLTAAAAHRPFNTDTPAHRRFKEAHLQKALRLKEKYPFLRLEDITGHFSV